jgi:hypothetical protein
MTGNSKVTLWPFYVNCLLGPTNLAASVAALFYYAVIPILGNPATAVKQHTKLTATGRNYFLPAAAFSFSISCRCVAPCSPILSTRSATVISRCISG